MNEVKASVRDLSGKYLTFNLGDEGYGIEILKVQEIIGIQNITRVPRAPDYVKGVINLRGKVIPVIDLRLKFGMPEKEFTRETCIIMVQAATDDGYLIMGLIVDIVSEVLDIAQEQIEPPPSLGTSVDTRFILGMARTDSDVKILLDIDRVLSLQEMTELRNDTVR